MKLDTPLSSELTVLQDIGDHPYALCHRDNAPQVAKQDIEDLLLILNPIHVLSIQREGDVTHGPYPAGWVMLLDDDAAVTQALQELAKQFAKCHPSAS